MHHLTHKKDLGVQSAFKDSSVQVSEWQTQLRFRLPEDQTQHDLIHKSSVQRPINPQGRQFLRVPQNLQVRQHLSMPVNYLPNKPQDTQGSQLSCVHNNPQQTLSMFEHLEGRQSFGMMATIKAASVCSTGPSCSLSQELKWNTRPEAPQSLVTLDTSRQHEQRPQVNSAASTLNTSRQHEQRPQVNPAASTLNTSRQHEQRPQVNPAASTLNTSRQHEQRPQVNPAASTLNTSRQHKQPSQINWAVSTPDTSRQHKQLWCVNSALSIQICDNSSLPIMPCTVPPEVSRTFPVAIFQIIKVTFS